MSPTPSPPPSPAARRTVERLAVSLGLQVRDARLRRRWSLVRLATAAGISATTVHHVEAGRLASLETHARLASALGLRLDAAMVDPRRPSAGRDGDIVHATMGEVEAGRLRARGYRVGIDEPYQHYQFAGRADLIAWSERDRAFLHVENRTRFPDLQEAVGSFNAKRTWLGRAICDREGLATWQNETHVLAVAWSAEALRDIRRFGATIRSVCPDPPIGFAAWWEGVPPPSGRRSEIVVLDPADQLGRKVRWVDLDRALAVRPRHPGYASLADALERASR